MKTKIMLTFAVLAATIAFAEQSVFSVFPKAGGDLALQSEWGDVAKPTASDHVKISNGGTYLLSDDLSIASLTLTAKDVIFDFTDGNKKLTLNTMVQGWGNVQSLFQYAHDLKHPTVIFKGGVWHSASAANTFSFVPLGTFDNSHSHEVTLSDGCIITNVGTFYTSRRMGNTRTLVSDGSSLYGNSMVLYDVSGTNNVLEIASGGSVNMSTGFACDLLFGNAGQEKTASYFLNDLVDVHGQGSVLNAYGSDAFVYVGQYAAGVGMRIRDGGALQATNLFVSANGGSSNNWLEVIDGGRVSATAFRCVGHHNNILVSNSTFAVSSSYDFSLGYAATSHDNVMRVMGPLTTFSVPIGGKNDVLARNYFGYGNTFSLEDGAQWLPRKSQFSLCVMSNNTFRVTGSGTVFDNAKTSEDGTYYSTYVGLDANDGSNSKASLSNSWNNVVEILDGAEFRANRFFVHGFNNRLVISNATLVTGSYEGADGNSGFGVWVGRGASSGCALVLQGSTPKIRATYATHARPVLLQNGAVLRYEIPREGYPVGHVAIQMKELTSAGWSDKNRIEIDCDEWAARRESASTKLVLFRGSANLSYSRDFVTWFNNQDLHLPPNVTCTLRGTDIVLHRRNGMIISFH